MDKDIYVFSPSKMKTRPGSFHSSEIGQGIVQRIRNENLIADIRAPRSFSSPCRGCSRFPSRSPNNFAKRFVCDIEAFIGKSLCHLFERFTRHEGGLDLREEGADHGGLGGRRFGGKFFQAAAVSIFH
jgi:hypothetical protein